MNRVLICALAYLLPCATMGQSADFTADRTSGCAGLLTVNFSDASTGSISSHQWSFGDGGTSNIASPSHTYTSPGSYTVSLTVTGPGGSDTETRNGYITVFAVPQASFVLSDDTICEGNTVIFTSTSSVGDGAITSCLWTFNDGSPADTGCPSIGHVFTNGSTTIRTFYPNLLVVDANGCNSVDNDTLVILPRPAASFYFLVNNPCTAPATVTFNNTTQVSGPLSWDFGINGSSSDTSSASSPAYTYNTPGTYTVTLTAGSNGCSTSISQIIQLESPQADFQISDTIVCLRDTVYFQSTGTSGAYAWDFGDPSSTNNTASSDSCYHVFNTPGNYTITLDVSTGGCSDRITRTVRVVPLPSIWFVADDRRSCSIPFTVQFYDSTRAAVAWSWNFGDPSSAAQNTSSLENPSHTFNSFGNFSVSLTVTDTNGCTNTGTYQDYIITAPVTIDFSDPDSGCVGSTFNFYAQVSSPGDPIISSFIWDYGDGSTPDTTFSGVTSHLYSDSGIFDVTLTVITSTGCTATLTKPEFIRVGILPTADFSAQPLTICFQDTVTFLDLSPQPPNVTAWLWSFGDGGGSQSQNPVYVYSIDTSGTADPFNVTLIVFHNGCPDTLTRTDYISVLGPKPNFTPVYDCNDPLTVRFINLSDTLGIVYLWNFGDNDTSTSREPSHAYASRGDYMVTLLDSNITTGCAASITLPVNVRVLDAIATASTDSGCAPLTVNVVGSASQDYSFLRWNFGDPPSTPLNGSSFADTLHLFNRPGPYTISLTATDIHGCSQTETIPIAVLGPQAGFIASPTTGCPPLNVTFNDTSQTYGSSIVNWSWNFGNGQTANGNFPAYTATYGTAGNFLPYLVVTDAFGCTSQFTPNYYIRPTQPQPTIAVNPNDTNACRNELLTFSASPGPVVADPVSYAWHLGDGTDLSGQTITHAFSDNGTYPVTVVATDANGCQDSTTTQILVYTTPAHVTITPFDSCVEQNGIRQAQVFVSMSSDSNLYATNWSWDLELTTISQNLSSIFYTYSVPPDTYYVSMVLTNQFGCRDTFFDPAAVVIPGPQGSYSFAPDSGCRPLTVTFAGGGSNIDLYTWDFGDGTVLAGTTEDTVVHTYTSDSTYTPRFYVGFELISSGATCYVPTDPIGTIEVTSLLGVDVLPETLFVQEGGSGQVAVEVNSNGVPGPYAYQWSPPGSVNPSTAYADSFEIAAAAGEGYYLCTVPYGTGCSSVDSFLLVILPCEKDLVIPNIFTPNGDGKNDEYHIEDLCDVPGFKFIIYNRWGRLIFESNSPDFRWPGTDTDGNPVNEGTYYFVMTTAKSEKHGWIEVIRE